MTKSNINTGPVFNGTHKTIKKGTILHREGDVSPSSYKVVKGLLRSYTIDEKGKEHIFMFAPEGWFIGDIESHAFDKPTDLYIDALEDSEVIVSNFKNEQFKSSSQEELVQNVELLSRRLGVLQRRVLMLMGTPAIKRYDHFIETYPKLLQRIPQRMIASYLGITPEALSKIRGQINKSSK